MGAISMNAPNGRVYLGSGSTTTTQGSVAVAYGLIQSGDNPSDLGTYAWVLNPHSGQINFTLVQAAPAGSVTLTGPEVIVRDGATVDVSGGGSIYSSLFVSSYSGTNNPLTGSYVILPGNGVILPGNSVYLAGIKGLPAGTYSLLPVTDANGNPTPYVYLPGAMIVTDLGTTIASSFKQLLTADGYPIVAGYATTMGTGISSPLYQAYEVRPASVVLAEGDFETQSMVAGNAGSVKVAGSTTVLGGTIRASALPGYNGGSIVVSGASVGVLETNISLPSDFSFSTSLASVCPDLVGTLDVAASALSGEGFKTVGIGYTDPADPAGSITASTLTVKAGTLLQAENIILAADNSIALDAGSRILALASPGDTGQASLIAPSGTAVIGSDAVIHASDAVNLQLAGLSLDPTAILMADHSTLNLTGTSITIAGSQEVSTSGFSLTAGQWNKLVGGFDDVDLTAVNLSVPSAPQAGAIVFDGLTGADYLAAVKDTLTLDAGLVTTRVNGLDTGSVVTLAAQNIVLQNTSGASSTASASRGTGELTFQAQQMVVGKGNIQLDGFSAVNMDAANDLTFRGAGQLDQATGATFRSAGVLATGGADLNIAAAMVTTAPYMQPAGTDPTTRAVLAPVYTAADFLIDTTDRDSAGNPTGGGGKVSMTAGTGTAGTAATPGGTLAITAGQIDISTIVEVPSGQIDLTATRYTNPSGILVSTGNIDIGSGGRLLARGYYTSSRGQTVQTNAPGGVVSLTSTGGGAINIASGALIDVSAGAEGDAGSISLYAPFNASTGTGGVTLNGNIQGRADDGKGGSFSMVTGSLDTINGINYFTALNSDLVGGGFTNTLNIEATTGNITIASGQKVIGQNVTVTADAGSMDLTGAVDVSGSIGGTAALYAMDNLTVESTGAINAYGTSGAGGNVTLGVGGGSGTTTGLAFAGSINVGGATGGTVTFQAPVTANGTIANFANGLPGQNVGLNMALNGTVTGASSVIAEAVNVYSYGLPGGLTVSTSPSSSSNLQINTVESNTSTFMNNYAGSIETGLLASLTLVTPVNQPAAQFQLQSGILIENTGGDITLSSPWALTSWRYGSVSNPSILTEPGTLTLRAEGNLNIDANIYDNPSGVYPTTPAPSWNINLVAGANTASANPMAVIPNAPGATAGNLTIASGKVVYTESGSIGFASGGNTVVNSPGSAYSAPLNQYYGYNLATYSGSIRGNVDGSLTLAGGVIASAAGNIDIDAGGDLTLGWNSANNLLGGILTTGEPYSGVTNLSTYANGGSISLDVGGDIDGQVIPSIVWLAETTTETITGSRGNRKITYTYTVYPNYADPQGILAMAGGGVSVRSGGNIEAQLGTFGAGDLTVYAGGDLEGRFLVKDGTGRLSAMGNFGMPEQVVNGFLKSWAQLIEMYNAQISVTAQGNVELGAVVNPDLAYTQGNTTGYYDNTYTPSASISLTAVTGDVNLYGSIDARYGSFYGATGASYLPASVEIAAGGNINVMAGADQLPAGPSASSPSSPYGTLSMTAGGNIVFSNHASWPRPMQTRAWSMSPGPLPHLRRQSHAYTPVYANDPNPVVISAGGDITDMYITLPERASIFAGGNITDLYFTGQNIRSTDVRASKPGEYLRRSGGRRHIPKHRDRSERPRIPGRPGRRADRPRPVGQHPGRRQLL